MKLESILILLVFFDFKERLLKSTPIDILVSLI